MLKEKTCTFDIDGIISDYPNCWLKYINIKASTSFTSKDVAKKTIGIDKYNYYKDLYRKSSYKANLPINNGAIETIQQVWEKGYNIVIATSRPFERYPNLYKTTYNWLIRAGLSRFDLKSKKSVIEELSNIEFHVDDELEHCKPFLQANIRCF